ncbi:MAG TPA: MFS transporter [Gemmatimonadaceae bacterium]|nr:MFS transporter [Gemmatimonadaceae bacterium]
MSGYISVAVAHDPYAALRVKNYRWFIVSLWTMTISSQIQAVVVAWQIYDITRDPLSLGLMGLAEALPFIGASLYAGHVADRSNRRIVSLAALSVLVGCSLAFLIFNLVPGFLAAHGAWPFYAVIFASGLARSFLQPARQALGAELIERSLYANAVAWRSSTWQSAAVIGPAVGGLIYGFSSARVAYVADAILMAVALTMFLSIDYKPRAILAELGSIGDSLQSGLRFVFGESVLLAALTLDLFSVLLGGAEALLPVFADQILHVGPQGLGILRAAPAVGAVVASVYLAHRPPFRHAGRTLLYAVGAFALCIIGFGISRSFLVSLLLLAVSGMADNVSVLIRSTLLQMLTPAHLYGRVSSVNSIFVGSSNEIGAFESGVAAKLLGTVLSVVLGGMASLGVVAAIGWKVPRLRRLGRIDELVPEKAA